MKRKQGRGKAGPGKTPPVKARNPMARLLGKGGFEAKTVPSAKAYRRRAKHPSSDPGPEAD